MPPRTLAFFLFVLACNRAQTTSSPAPAPAPTPVAVPPVAAPEPHPFQPAPKGCMYRVVPPLVGDLAVTAEDAKPPREQRYVHLHLTAVGPATHAMVAQWNTDPADRATVVRLRTVGGDWHYVHGFSFPLPGAAHVRHHEAHLCGLTPATLYEYAVGEGEDGRVWRFRTAPEGPEAVTALVVGDARTHPEVWAQVARAAAREAPELLLFTGDAVGDGGDITLWSRFFEGAEELLATTPGLWADGNHEGVSAVYYDQFALPGNEDRTHHERWYTATWGPLRIIALNDVTVPAEEITGAQRTFLEATLRAVDRQQTPWVLTMHHQPMHTDAEGHDPDLVTRRAWGPLLDRYRVDLDLSGHVHNYESSRPMRSDGAVVAEGQGTRYLVFGGAGAPLYGFRRKEPWVSRRESTHGYALLRARRDRITWEAHRVDGSVIETIDVPWRAPGMVR